MKKVISLALTLSTLLILMSPPSRASLCAQTLNRLGHERVEALQRADAGDYKVSILSGDIDGREKTVVLLGEWHVKNDEATQLGKEVIQHFKLRGLEGADTNKLAGKRLMSWFLTLLRPAAQFFTLGSRQNSSSIDDAERRESLIEAKEELKTRIDNETFEQAEAVLLTVRVEGEDLTAQQVLDELGIDDLETHLTPSTNTSLEEGHKPKFSEHAASVFYPLGFIISSVSLLTWVVSIAAPENATISTALSILKPVNHFIIAQLFGPLMFRRWETSKIYNWAFFLGAGFLTGRNKTMVANINKALSQSDEELMLVIVGKAHNSGMVRLLTDQYGFQSIELPLTD